MSSDGPGSDMVPNLTSPTCVRNLLAELGVRPNRSLGQNFLIDRNILRLILGDACLSPGDTVLEVGPGLGVVTCELLARGARVIAVEKDARLAAYLRERFSGCAEFSLVQADMLDMDVAAAAGSEEPAAVAPEAPRRGRIVVPESGYRLVSNLPYAAGSRILVSLSQGAVSPAAMTVTVQQEVAERICARPHGRDHGLLTVLLGLRYTARVTRKVKASCFWPRPEVASAVVVLEQRGERLLPAGLEETYYRLVKHAYGRRRKQLSTIMRSAPGMAGDPASAVAVLESAGIPPAARPQDVDVATWCRLVRVLAQMDH
jgi:16S rRNA (adenine1518-N6/adenine1519-N6)-dimethyltransferase